MKEPDIKSHDSAALNNDQSLGFRKLLRYGVLLIRRSYQPEVLYLFLL